MRIFSESMRRYASERRTPPDDRPRGYEETLLTGISLLRRVIIWLVISGPLFWQTVALSQESGVVSLSNIPVVIADAWADAVDFIIYNTFRIPFEFVGLDLTDDRVRRLAFGGFLFILAPTLFAARLHHSFISRNKIVSSTNGELSLHYNMAYFTSILFAIFMIPFLTDAQAEEFQGRILSPWLYAITIMLPISSLYVWYIDYFDISEIKETIHRIVLRGPIGFAVWLISLGMVEAFTIISIRL